MGTIANEERKRIAPVICSQIIKFFVTRMFMPVKDPDTELQIWHTRHYEHIKVKRKKKYIHILNYLFEVPFIPFCQLQAPYEKAAINLYFIKVHHDIQNTCSRRGRKFSVPSSYSFMLYKSNTMIQGWHESQLQMFYQKKAFPWIEH